MIDLGTFLKEQCANCSPWNCSTLAADWCVALGYPDFAWAWRDITEAGACEAAPAEGGGLVALWAAGIGDYLTVVDGPPQAGDIAVLNAQGYEAGGIFTGERWAIKAARGLHFIPDGAVKITKAWRT